MGLVEEMGEPVPVPVPEPAWGRTGGLESAKVLVELVVVEVRTAGRVAGRGTVKAVDVVGRRAAYLGGRPRDYGHLFSPYSRSVTRT